MHCVFVRARIITASIRLVCAYAYSNKYVVCVCVECKEVPRIHADGGGVCVLCALMMCSARAQRSCSHATGSMCQVVVTSYNVVVVVGGVRTCVCWRLCFTA